MNVRFGEKQTLPWAQIRMIYGPASPGK